MKSLRTGEFVSVPAKSWALRNEILKTWNASAVISSLQTGIAGIPRHPVHGWNGLPQLLTPSQGTER